MKNYGLLLLGVWLAGRSGLDLLGVSFPYQKLVLQILALVAGSLLILNEFKARLESMGTLLLGIWLAAGAAMALSGYGFASSKLVMAVLALVAGVLLILRK